MAILWFILLLILVGASLLADFLWRRWMAERKQERR